MRHVLTLSGKEYTFNIKGLVAFRIADEIKMLIQEAVKSSQVHMINILGADHVIKLRESQERKLEEKELNLKNKQLLLSGNVRSQDDPKPLTVGEEAVEIIYQHNLQYKVVKLLIEMLQNGLDPKHRVAKIFWEHLELDDYLVIIDKVIPLFFK